MNIEPAFDFLQVEKKALKAVALNRRNSFILAVCLLLAPLIAQAQNSRVLGEPANPALHKKNAELDRAFVSAIDPAAPKVDFVAVVASRIEQAKLANLQKWQKVTQIGITQLDGEALGGIEPSLNWQAAAAGGFTAQFKVQTLGALGVRVGLKLGTMPAGSSVRVSGTNDLLNVTHAASIGEVLNSLDAEGRYWSALTEGDTQFLEVYLPQFAEPTGLSISVAGVSHIFALAADNFKAATQPKGASGACEVDVICAAQTQAFVNAKNAVAHMVFQAACGLGGAIASCVCTGTLLNDSDTTTQVPYFYGANHCISTQTEASSLITYWNYENATCRGPDVARTQSTAVQGGADLLYANQSNDVLLLKLRSTPPASAFFSGWDAATITASAAATIIHHPAGDPKKVTLAQTLANPFTALSDLGGSSFITATYTSGVTEGGSSGSGLLSLSNGSYFLRGGLYGGPSSCATAGNVSDPNNLDYYSRFDLAYPSLRTWLGSTTPPPPTAVRRPGIDIDGDGKNEIVVRSAGGQTQVGRLVNNVLQFTSTGDPGTGFRLVGAGDFNGDGKTDLAFQNMTQGTFGDVKIWPSFLSAGEIFWRQVKQVWDVQAVGDLDGDGFGDLVWRYVVTDSPDTGVSYIWFTNGSSVTQVRKRGGAPLDWKLLGAQDLNADGSADMVYLSPQNQLRVLMATPNRTCANLASSFLPTGFSPLKFADFTGNARGDVLLRNAAGAVQLMSLNATGLTLPPYTGAPDDQNASCTASTLTVSTTTLSLPTTDPTWTFYASGDLDGDGVNDIIWRQSSGTLTVWLMKANGAAPTVIQNAGTAPTGFGVFQNGGP